MKQLETLLFRNTDTLNSMPALRAAPSCPTPNRRVWSGAALRVSLTGTLMSGKHPPFDLLLRDDTQNVLVQLFRYTFVGGIAFLVDFSALFLFTRYLGIHYLVSAGLGFCLGVATNYSLSISWVFSVHRFSSRNVEFGIFALIGIVGLALNEALIWFFTEIVLFHYLASKVAATFFVYLWNFFSRRFLLFQGRPAHE